MVNLNKLNHRQCILSCVFKLNHHSCKARNDSHKSQHLVQPLDLIHRFYFLGNHPSNILEKMAGKELCSETKRGSQTTSRMGETGGTKKTERKS